MGAAFLRIMIVSYIVRGLVVTLSLVQNGVGDALVQMPTNLATMIFIQLVAAYVLLPYTSPGVYGISWAEVTGIGVREVIYASCFKAGDGNVR